MANSPPAPSTFDGDLYNVETTFQRITRRIKEEPLVPFGMILTVAALIGAGRALKTNDHRRANIMFRRRVYAQGFTLLCICVGAGYWGRDREKRKEYEQLAKDKVNAVKRDRWLAELEARDEEDKAAKDRVVRLREKRQAREDQVRQRIRDEGGAENGIESKDLVDEEKGNFVEQAKKLLEDQKGR